MQLPFLFYMLKTQWVSVCTLLCISQLSDSDKEMRFQPLQQIYLSAGFAIPPLIPVRQEDLLTTPYLAEQNKTKLYLVQGPYISSDLLFI